MPLELKAKPTTMSARACLVADCAPVGGGPRSGARTRLSATPSCTAPSAARPTSTASPVSASRSAIPARSRWSRAPATMAASI